MYSRLSQADFEKIVVSRRDAVLEFIKKSELEMANDRDFWAQNDIDIQFSEDDDDKSETFGQMQYWAYPVSKDDKGNITTGTQIFIKIEKNS